MELDNIKDLWNKEEIAETPEVSTDQQNEIHNPLQKIRKNMRMEFWSTVILLIVGMFLLYYSIENLKLKTYTFTLISVMLCITGFYYKKFFLLYKELGNVAVNTKDALKDLLHQFELNKQYYVAYYLAFAPFLVCEMILLNEFKYLKTPLGNEPQHIQDISAALLFAVSTIFGLFFLYAAGKWWFQQYYGKYIDSVVLLNNQISGGYEQEVKKIEKRKNNLFSKTDRFFTSKMGKTGSFINTFIWIITFLCLILLLVFVCGFIIAFTLSYFNK